MKTVSEFLPRLGATVKGLVKLVLQSRRRGVAGVSPSHGEGGGRIIILGNGPSLNDTIAAYLPLLQSMPCMAVNFAANAPQFMQLRPRFYILVDPHFFSGKDDAGLNSLWDNLRLVSWRMSLIVPAADAGKARALLGDAGEQVDILTINAVGVEGFRWFTDLAYARGLGMPRPRNVLIPAIMAAMQLGYKEIYITGADHSWLKTISVNENNEVQNVQPHFYKEDDREVRRINTEYLRYPLHQVIHSFYVAFKSYHDLQAYAQRRGVKVYNATPGSYIDAFPRKSLSAI